jgi:hypothetical protein
MALMILKHILYGELRPWIVKDNQIPAVGRLPKDEKISRKDLLELLIDYPETAKELQEEWNANLENYTCVDPYFEVDIKNPFDRKTSFYRMLIDSQGKDYLNRIIGKINGLDSAVDRKFELNSAIRHLEDLLLNTRKSLDIHKDKQSKYILQRLEKLSIRLILELSSRYPELDGIDRYSEQSIYTSILNQPPPDSPSFSKTPAYSKQILQQLLRESVSGALKSEMANFLAGIIKKMRNLSQASAESSASFHAYNRLLNHCENAAFLIYSEASFIEDTPQKLLESDYCREWVHGLRLDFIAETNPDKSAQLLSTLAETCAGMEAELPGIGSENIQGAKLSEAAALLAAMNKINMQQFLNTSPASHTNRKEDSSESPSLTFVDSFNKRYITLDEFREAINQSERTVQRYLEKSDIRVLEFSSNVKFLYREDVEDFLKNRTKD